MNSGPLPSPSRKTMISLSAATARMRRSERGSPSVPELAPHRRLLGLIAFGDAIKPTAIGAVSALRTAGIRTLQAALMSGASCTRPERARSPRRAGASNGRVVAQQMTEAFPWDTAPRYLVRDRNAVYGHVVRRRLGTLGIRDRPTAPRSPWQNGYVERLIGSIRRECLDHMIVLGESHLRRIVSLYARAGCAGSES